jgi:hypothetical protein
VCRTGRSASPSPWARANREPEDPGARTSLAGQTFPRPAPV